MILLIKDGSYYEDEDDEDSDTEHYSKDSITAAKSYSSYKKRMIKEL